MLSAQPRSEKSDPYIGEQIGRVTPSHPICTTASLHTPLKSQEYLFIPTRRAHHADFPRSECWRGSHRRCRGSNDFDPHCINLAAMSCPLGPRHGVSNFTRPRVTSGPPLSGGRSQDASRIREATSACKVFPWCEGTPTSVSSPLFVAAEGRERKVITSRAV